MTISLIIPCYNEEVNIQKGVLDRIGNFVSGNSEFKEVLIVDDGSTDGTKEIIKKEYLPRFSTFRYIEKEHQGKALAVIKGIEEAKSEFVIFSDIDLATPLDEANNLIAEFKKGNKIVIGSRAKKRSGAPFSRRLQSVGFIIIRDIIIGLKGIVDTQCGFKGFERKAALQIINKLQVFGPHRHVSGSSVSAGFDLEFLFLARKLGYSITEVPVEWRHAETKNVDFIKDSIETISDVVEIRINDLQGKYK